MDFESFVEYCMNKPATTDHFPFDEKTLVFKVANKMYALANADDFQSINLKCDPERAQELRERYSGINPGYHMSKVHWNTVSVFEDVPDKLIYELIDHSYDLIVNSLPKKSREELK